MLKPELRLLDPEKEQLERIASLANNHQPDSAWLDTLKHVDIKVKTEILRRAEMQLKTPGIHSGDEVDQCLRTVALDQGVATLEPKCFGWPRSVWEKLLEHNPGTNVLVLGILDQDGIWAGGIAGVVEGQLDFISTFRTLWYDEPELASKQSFDDLPELCRIVQKKFNRPVRGLFIYRNEFIQWRDQQWSVELLHSFIENRTAVRVG